MLTMDETLAAIAALNTDADILRRACMRCISPSMTYHSEKLTPEIAAKELLIYYNESFSGASGKVTEALCIALGTQAAMTCKPGMEVQLLRNLFEYIREQFRSTRSLRIQLMAAKHPERAVEFVLASLAGLVEAEEEEEE